MLLQQKAAAAAPALPSIYLSIHPSVQALSFFRILLPGEVRARIVVGQLHVLLLLMNFKQKKNLSTEKITMPLHVRKGSTCAAGVCLESNHSLSNDPYLPSFPSPPLPHSSSSSSSHSDHHSLSKHRCPMWGGGGGTLLEKK